MNMHQALVGLPNGLQAIIDELKSRGYETLISVNEDTGLEELRGIHRCYNCACTDRDTRCTALLLGEETIMTLLETEPPWMNAEIIAVAPRGEDLNSFVDSVPTSRTLYDNYITPHRAFLDVDGNETDVDTGIPNPLAGQMSKWMAWA